MDIVIGIYLYNLLSQNNIENKESLTTNSTTAPTTAPATTSTTSESTSSSNNILLILIIINFVIAPFITIWAVAMSWSCSTEQNLNLFLKFWYAFWAMIFGTFYLLYKFIRLGIEYLIYIINKSKNPNLVFKPECSIASFF